jgi:hypothetical protein
MAWQEACEGEKGGFDAAYTAGGRERAACGGRSGRDFFSREADARDGRAGASGRRTQGGRADGEEKGRPNFCLNSILFRSRELQNYSPATGCYSIP